MMFEETYKTITENAEGVYREKGSKFIALAFPVSREKEITEILQETKKKYHDARHHCYAYILGADKSALRINDDGEPSGTAGRPIYGQLCSKDLTDILVIVVRYFGGIKLGVGGLINAYKIATQDALANSTIIEKPIEESYKVIFPFLEMNKVMSLLKSDRVTILSQSFNNECVIEFSIHKSAANRIVALLKPIGEVMTIL
jgi:uncharacterized YigZ family protein